MAINVPTLAAALQAVGNAHVYKCSDITVGNWSSLGVKEGEVKFDVGYKINKLTADELTGGIWHQATATLDHVTLTIPLILPEALDTLWPSLNPIGGATSGGGHSSPQDVAPYAIALIPNKEIGAGLSFNGTSWTPAAPTAAVWLWRVIPMPGSLPFQYQNGGKVITEITFDAGFYSAAPEGEKVFTIGDPDAKGVTMLVA